MKKFLIRRVFVKSTDQNIIVGENDSIIYAENNMYNNDLLEQLTSVGVDNESVEDAPFLNELESRGWLCENLPPIDRTASFFESLDVNFSGEVRNLDILIFGAGGGGGTLAYMLGQFGFTNLHIVDFDKVEISDCHKTMVYRASDVGHLKTIAIKRLLLENFGLHAQVYDSKVDNINDVKYLVDKIKPALIVNAIDPNPVHKLNLNIISHNANVPLIFMSYSFENLSIGPLFVPGKTSCYESVRSMTMNSTDQRFDISKIKNMYTDYLKHPSISFVINSLASVLAKEIVLFLSGRSDLALSLNTFVWFSVLTMEGSSIEMKCSATCPVCKGMYSVKE